MWYIYLAIIVALLLIYWWKHFARKPHPKFPPGPVGLPILGYVPIFQAKNIIEGLDTLHDKYGDVISLNLGPSPRIVILGEYETLKEVFRHDKSTERPPSTQWPNKEFRSGNGHDSRGLIFSVGHEWTEQRRFALRRLRDFGLGKSSMEDLILTEIHQLCNFLDKQIQQPLKINLAFNLSVVNALWTLITGSRLSLEDPELIHFVGLIDELVKEASNISVVNIFPPLRHVFPVWTGWEKTKAIFQNIFKFIDHYIQDHVNEFNLNRSSSLEDPKDFIDAFLGKIEDSSEESSFHGTLGLQNLRAVLIDLLFAGIETTSTTLTWSVLYMSKYPKVQKKVQQEILATIGQSRPIRMDDKPNLPYTEAVTQEILRLTCIAPLAVPHYTTGDIDVGKYCIPKGTVVMPNLHRITRNPIAFKDPNTFNPERFLDSSGKYVKNDFNIPFGIGKRDCLGKSLALTETFLFFASLMQRYHFTTTTNPEELDLTPTIQVTQIPPPAEVIITKLSTSSSE